MPNTTTIGSDGYDDVNDVYSTPTDAERLAYVEKQVQELWRAIGAVNYPSQRNSGGAVDSQIVMGGK